MAAGGGCELTDASISECLEEADLMVERASLQQLESSLESTLQYNAYDYIVVVGALERSKNPAEILAMLKKMLRVGGRLFLGMDNRLGIRYFCGDKDSFTDRNFDGIENYARINPQDMGQLEGRAYARAEIAQMLEAAGFAEYRFYSVFPSLHNPQILLAEDYLPKEELEVRIFPQYNCPDTVFLEEERIYTALKQNGMLHAMANGFLVECPLETECANVYQVTVSMERGVEHAMSTIIRRDGMVEKRAAYAEGQRKLEQLVENHADLSTRGIKVVDAALEQDSYVMPYVEGMDVTQYFRGLLETDQELFLKELDRFWELILQSSEHVPYEQVNWEQFEPGWERRKADDPERDKWRKIAFGTEEEKQNLGVILKRGYIDLVSVNCLYVNGEFVFFDQEFRVENLPANMILYRTINMIYNANNKMDLLFSKEKLRERYHLNEFYMYWNRFEAYYIRAVLQHGRELKGYYNACRRDAGIVHSNRQRMNYSADEYEKLFRDIFRGTEGRKVYLFGSGNFTKKFLSQFGADVDVAGIIDNNQEKWGQELSGLTVYSAEHLTALSMGSYKVIVCIKNYIPVLKQLRQMEIRDYAVYDPNVKYPRVAKPIAVTASDVQATPKKYHVGYIAGVFDLYHVGHLNMFKRAKEQCDYLIVGVVTDEGVRKGKGTIPYVPFEERIEMVRSCRYVDEAVEIPPEYSDTDEAYRRYQFDVQFSGSDYAEDPAWLAKKVFLQKNGSDMVFFPYTQSTSSTKLKALIEKGLL